MRGWFGRLIETVGLAAAPLLAASLWASPAAAQAPPPVAHTTDVWGALSAGLANSDGSAAFAGQLALSRAVDQRVITLRAAGAANFSDYASTDRDYADVALLVGRRITNPKIPGPGNLGGMTASISLGPAGLWYTQAPTVSSPERSGVVPAIAFNADVMSHLRVIGLGVSIFGASGVTDRYLGVGLTLGLGKIH